MSTIDEPDEPEQRTYSPDEAMGRALPLPRREDLVIESVTDEEWEKFLEVLEVM